MTELPPLHGCSYFYPLAYAGSWLFSVYNTSTASESTVRLARDEKTGYFAIAVYDKSKKAWRLPTAFDHTMVHAYCSDYNTRLRILGWKDCFKHDELQVYLDVEFINNQDYLDFVTLYRHQYLSWSNNTLSASEMSDTFCHIPSKPGSDDPAAKTYLPQHASQPAHYRKYEPESKGQSSGPTHHREPLSTAESEALAVRAKPSVADFGIGDQLTVSPPSPEVTNKTCEHQDCADSGGKPKHPSSEVDMEGTDKIKKRAQPVDFKADDGVNCNVVSVPQTSKYTKIARSAMRGEKRRREGECDEQYGTSKKRNALDA